MAEEEDDDESFGEFTFASFPNQPFPNSTSNHHHHFVNHSNQINGASSKPVDLFSVSPDPTKNHVVNDNNGIAIQANKSPGAIPLSIFGEEDDGEQEPASAANDFFSYKSNGAVRNGSGSNGSVGISDLISNLYNHQPPVNSQNGGSVSSISNGSAPSPNADGVTNSLNPDLDEEGGWEFKSAEWETGTKSQNLKDEVPKHGNGAVGVGDLFDSTGGVSNGVAEWHLGFEFNSNSASHSPRSASKRELNKNRTENTMFNQDFGHLKNAHSWPGSNQTLEVPQKTDKYPTSSIEVLKDDGGTSHSTIDPSLASESYQSDGWDFGFSFNSSSLGEGCHTLESTYENNWDENNKSNASPTNINVGSNVNLCKSNGAVTEIRIKHENPPISSENRREALPLSIFGDEMPDTNEHSVSPVLSSFGPISPTRNSFNSPCSTISINDLIWNLYNQPENKDSPNVTPKASENQTRGSPEISGSNLVGNDDFDDDFGDFKDASPVTVLNSDLINGNDDFEDGSWEFKDAISGTRNQDQASTVDRRDLLTQLSTKLEPSDIVEYFSKLKDELCNDVLFHLQNLKKAQDGSALLGEDAKVKAVEVEIQEYSEILHLDNMSIPDEYLSENYSPRNVNFDELLEVLKDPKFQSLDSEYQLASRLSMAEKDVKSAMELLKDAVSTLRILKLRSIEEQSNYLTIWSKIAFVCSQELKHGAYIWKQALQKNVHGQILSVPKGIQYIHALGEIYRVAEIIGASAKVHKLWMLSGSIDPTSLFALLNECNSLWLASGLEEALWSISNQNNFNSDDISRELVESINYIHELDEHAFQSYVISGEETTCQFSALPAGCIPGLNLVTWNGNHYFVQLANLWLNLISSDPPN